MWIEDLLGLWAVGDIGGESRRLGFGAVSPMFERLGTTAEVDSDGSYSTAEVAALRTAVDRLAAEHPAEMDAVLYRFKPWTIAARGLQAQPELFQQAAQRLADWVDEAVDGP